MIERAMETHILITRFRSLGVSHQTPDPSAFGLSNFEVWSVARSTGNATYPVSLNDTFNESFEESAENGIKCASPKYRGIERSVIFRILWFNGFLGFNGVEVDNY